MTASIVPYDALAAQSDGDYQHQQLNVTPIRGFQLLTPSQVDARRESLSWVVDEWLQGGGLNMLFGASGSYKSFIALDFALHIATGRAWHNLPTKAGAVVYVAAEGASGLPLRREAWEQRHETKVGDRFLTLQFPVNLTRESDVAMFITQVNMLHEPPVMIVFDTLSRCASGVDENNPGAASTVVDALDRIRRETGALSILVLHHTAKGNTDSPRGTTGYPAAMDSVLRIAKSGGNTAKLSRWKERDGEDSGKITLQLDTIYLPGDVTSLAVGYSDAHDPERADRPERPSRVGKGPSKSTRVRREVVLKALQKSGRALTPKELAMEMGLKGNREEARRIQAHLTTLLHDVKVAKENGGRYRA